MGLEHSVPPGLLESSLPIHRVSEVALIYCSLGLLLLSCVDQGYVGTAIKMAWFVSFILVCQINLGAAFGIYVASVAIYAVQLSNDFSSNFQRPDNLAMLIFLVFLFRAGIRTPLFSERRWLVMSVTLFLAYTLLQMIGLGVMTRGLFFFCMRMFVVPFGLFLLFWRARLSFRELRAFIGVMVVLGSYVALVSILERLNWYSVLLPTWIGDPTFNQTIADGRSGGPFLQSEWNGFALGLLFCFVFAKIYETPPNYRIGKYLLLGFFGVGIYVTYTRAAWLAVAVATLILVWQLPSAGRFRKMKRLAAASAVLALLAIFVLLPNGTARDRFQDSGTVFYRFNLWASGLEMASQRLIFGYGFGQFQRLVTEYKSTWPDVPDMQISGEGNVAHNTLMDILVEQGAFGLILYIALIWQIFRAGIRAGASIWPTYGAGWVLAFSAVYCINAMFVVAFEPTTNYVFFGTMGLIASLGSRIENARAVSVEKSVYRDASKWRCLPTAG